jgi:hypothetical protein
MHRQHLRDVLLIIPNNVFLLSAAPMSLYRFSSRPVLSDNYNLDKQRLMLK